MKEKITDDSKKKKKRDKDEDVKENKNIIYNGDKICERKKRRIKGNWRKWSNKIEKKKQRIYERKIKKREEKINFKINCER